MYVQMDFATLITVVLSVIMWWRLRDHHALMGFRLCISLSAGVDAWNARLLLFLPGRVRLYVVSRLSVRLLFNPWMCSIRNSKEKLEQITTGAIVDQALTLDIRTEATMEVQQPSVQHQLRVPSTIKAAISP